MSCDDLGAVGPDAFAASTETRDRQQHGATKVSDEQFQHRRSGGEPGPPSASSSSRAIALQQLQLPEPLPVLDPVPQRDAATRESVVGRVVVGGDEDARLDRLAAELGQLELARRPQLHLALESSRESPSTEC